MAKKKNKGKKVKTGVETFCIACAAFYQSYNLHKYHPNDVGSFSVGNNGRVVNFNSTRYPQILDYRNMQLPLDLNVGFAEYTEGEAGNYYTSQHTGALPLYQKFLLWICKTNFDICDVDVIGRRGIFKKIGYTIFDQAHYPWTIRVCKYQNKLYLQELTPDDPDNKFTYWGRKFEEYMTATPEGIKSCYSMVRSTIGRYETLLGAEIDCIRTFPDRPPDFIELKTSFQTSQYKANKIAVAWLQCFLAGVDKLVFGLRDEHGLVTNINEQHVHEVLAKCQNQWSGEAMMGLVSAVLNWLHPRIEEGSTGVLSYTGQTGEIDLTGSRPGHFLPGWYVQHVEEFNNYSN